jgi:hypothetical protein
VKIIVADMHAEATSEKIAMGWHLDGRVSLLFGTHTHVQTADERVLPNGTAFISDLGACAPRDSVIGFEPDISIERMKTQLPLKNSPSDSPGIIYGAFIEVDRESGHARSIERVREESLV